MSDIRFNRWSHSTGTGGIFQDSSGRVGVGSSVPKTTLDVVGIVSATGAVISGVSTFSGNIIIGAGSTAAPSITPTGDSNTGIFFPSADTIAIAEGGVEAVRIDSSGRVTVPYQPSFCASKNNSEQTTSGTIVFNSDSGAGRHNTGSHYSTSTGTFTAPVAGRYVFMCSIHSTNGTYKVDVRLRINGSDAPGGFALDNVDSYTQATGCAVLNLAANDAVTIYNNNAGVWYDPGLTYFSGYLVG